MLGGEGNDNTGVVVVILTLLGTSLFFFYLVFPILLELLELGVAIRRKTDAPGLGLCECIARLQYLRSILQDLGDLQSGPTGPGPKTRAPSIGLCECIARLHFSVS